MRTPLKLVAVLMALLAGPVVSKPASNSVIAVRHWTLGDVTRVVVETTMEFEFNRDRVPDPDRLFFDLTDTGVRLGKRGMSTFPVNDPRLKQIRVAETAPGTARVVFDLEEGVEFSASMLSNPSRLIVELRRSTVVPPGPVPAGAGTTLARINVPDAAALPEPQTAAPSAPTPVTARADRTAAITTLPVTRRVPPETPGAASVNISPDQGAPPAAVASVSGPRARPEIPSPSPGAASVAAGTDRGASVTTREPPTSVLTPPTTRGTTSPASSSATEKSGGALSASSARISGTPPRPARLGSSQSMTRVLGLKIGRIVLDAGHGGHDTGTTGSGGLLEKELVLDVCKRLGELIEKRLHAEVIYTRTDDTFIPLERRTEIANENKADLFLSIHANSSPARTSSGVETYYLNFAASNEAMEVAARENASSQKTVYELSDLLQKIALQDKVEESRQFAARVQQSLYSASAKSNSRTRNRGVRRAPFVVLIGASMPSVLAEIGFISNPRDETLFRKPAFRQKIAEGLYEGVARYAATLSQFQVASN